jgi:hypothetical protein
VELLQKDYVICEAKKGLYRFMAEDERGKARIEDEKASELKVQKKLAQLAKEQKKAGGVRDPNKTPKQGPIYPVIGVELATLMAHQKAEYPTLEVPFLLVRFAADVMALGGGKEEGIFRLSVGVKQCVGLFCFFCVFLLKFRVLQTEEVAQMVHQINTGTSCNIVWEGSIFSLSQTHTIDNNYQLVRRDPNVAAVMMKRYLRDLPTTLMPDYERAIEVAKAHAPDAVFDQIFGEHQITNKMFVYQLMFHPPP